VLKPSAFPMSLRRLLCFTALLTASFVLHAQEPATSDSIKRGEYLAAAGDCMACHTVDKKQPYAGGLPMKVPMLGTIYSSNITPDAQTGLGNWSLEEFDRAVRKGIGRDGRNLYPAMPYPSYAKITTRDIEAMFEYFQHGVMPVKRAQQPSDIRWPLNMRWPLKIWNWMFLKAGSFQADEGHNAEWNRGAYLTQGLGHCGACHTPRGVAMQEKALDEHGAGYLGGASLSGWDAYNITSDRNSGIGEWTVAQIAQYLRTGNVSDLAQAAGPMGEAVQHSFSKLSAADVDAIAAYLHTVPAVHDNSARPRHAWGMPATDAVRLRGVALPASKDGADASDAARLYLGNCASCHQTEGHGTTDGYYPSLLRNSTVGARSADNLVQVILFGVHRVTPGNDAGMPGFANELTDAQIASLSNYLTAQFGNPEVRVDAGGVAKLRKGAP
jgi:mono/diheme cytochrome c family protein